MTSDALTTRKGPGGRRGGASDIASPESRRIRIDVPLGTPYAEIQESVYRQAYELAGTQLLAAVALGITPETLSRFLKRRDREKIGCPKVPKAWPVVAPPEPGPALEVSTGERVDSAPAGPAAPAESADPATPSASGPDAAGDAGAASEPRHEAGTPGGREGEPVSGARTPSSEKEASSSLSVTSDQTGDDLELIG